MRIYVLKTYSDGSRCLDRMTPGALRTDIEFRGVAGRAVDYRRLSKRESRDIFHNDAPDVCESSVAEEFAREEAEARKAKRQRVAA